MSDILNHVAGWLGAIPETQDDWWEKVKELAALHRGAGWRLAQWVAWGMDEYAIDAADLAIQIDRSEQTIRNYHSVMRNPAAKIAAGYGLSVSHAVEVLGLDAEEQASWLLRAREERWSTAKLRAELRNTRQPSTIQPLCHRCLEIDTTTPATKVADNGLLLCDHHYYEQRGFVDPAPDPTDYQYMDDDDDVPFSCHQEISIDIAPPVKAFEIAEYIIGKWGQQMAREVVEELGRWW